MYEHTNFDERPFVAVWGTTQACDLACVDCRACAQRLRHPLELTTEEAKCLNTDGIGRTLPGINAGQDFVFISQLGEVYPSGFPPLSGGNIRRQSLADIYRDSLFFPRLRNSQNLEGKFLARKSNQSLCEG